MMILHKYLLIFTYIAAFVLLPATINAATFYVSPSGNDTNKGSLESPWRTISEANSRLSAGDTVYIRAGEYQDSIKPVNSGYSDEYITKFITYSAYSGESVLITNPPDKIAINLVKRNYIKVDSINADGKGLYDKSNIDSWVDMIDSNYNIIQNCEFSRARGYKGVHLAGTSHHNKILNNRIDYVGGVDVGATDGSLNKGNMINIDKNSKYNLVSGNYLTHGGHNLLQVEGSYNIISNNVMDNSWGKNGYRILTLIGGDTSTGYNVVESNVMRNIGLSFRKDPYAPIMKSDGVNQIVRHNFMFNNIQEGVTGNSRTGILNNKAKIYNNVLYNNGGPAWRLQYFSSGSTLSNGVFKNNFALRDSSKAKYSGYNADIFFSLSASGDNFSNNKVLNNAFFDISSSGSKFKIAGVAHESLAWFENKYPAYFKNNITTKPGFVSNSPDEPNDFKLDSTSPLIDKGAFLSFATSNGSGNTIAVDDAGYFTDGFGLVEADKIVIGTKDSFTINKVNYKTNTITFNGNTSWNKGDYVSLPFKGDAPDIGVFEFGDSIYQPPTPQIKSLISL